MLREATFRDYPGIASLQVRNGLVPRSREDWMALWAANPAYRRVAGEWPIGWVLETDDRAIVGAIGNIPLAYVFRGRLLTAAAACAWAVDTGYRNYSMLLLNRLTRQEKPAFMISTTVSPASERPFRFLGWSKVPAGAWQESAFWITDYIGFARSALVRMSVPYAPLLSYAVSPALFCRDWLKGDRLGAVGPTPDVELCSGFDARFEGFWEELRRQNENTLLAVRSRESLDWCFHHSLETRSGWVAVASRGARILAYAVFDRRDNRSLGLRRVRLADFQALKGCEALLRQLLRTMAHTCRAEQVHVLEYFGNWLDGRVQISAPYRRALPSWAYYWRTNHEELRPALADPRVWAPTSYDGDASL